MTETILEEGTELEIDKEYLVGLLDFLTIPKLTPYKTEGGYGLSTEAWINVRQSDILAGLLTDVLDTLGLSFRLDYRDDTPSKILVRESNSIKQLRNLGKGSYIQIAEKIEYLDYIDEEYRGKPISGDPDLFLQIYKPWAELHPEWVNRSSKTYTLDYFKSEFGISSISNAEVIPEVTYPDEITEQYVSGTFDSQGRIDLKVRKSNQYSIGYSISPGIQIQISNPHLLVGPHLKKFFEERKMNPTIQEEQSDIRVQFSDVAGLERFIELVSPHLYHNYELCELFYEQLLPAYRDGYHHTKDGFFDMVRAYEEVGNSNRERKYDPEYFKSEWDV